MSNTTTEEKVKIVENQIKKRIENDWIMFLDDCEKEGLTESEINKIFDILF